jgi:hypothetical protein
MRPTLDRLWPGSKTRTTRNGFWIEQFMDPTLVMSEELAIDIGAICRMVGACDITLHWLVAPLARHLRTRVCNDLKNPDWANRARFIAANVRAIT